MIPGLDSLVPNSIGYLLFAAALVLLAWSPLRQWFVHGLSVAGLVVVLSWLSPPDVLALIVFMAIPYIAAVRVWGRKEMFGGSVAGLVLAWQIVLFLVVKRYAWFDILGVLDHPVSIIGVSYIMFRQIHLIVDAPFAGHLPFGIVRYIAFTLSPWTLIAGPIQRYDAFCKGIDDVRRPDTADVRKDSHRIVNGLIKAFVIAPVFLEPSRVATLALPDATVWDLLIVFYGYPVYLYLNFSGYVDIVIGAARLTGFTTLPENFNRPYLARNPADFWTRWHMSFGVWVRHYVFTPLSTRLVKHAPARWGGAMMALAVMITFYLVGAWHGTTSNFIVFGLLQGAGVVVSSAFGKALRRRLGGDKYKRLNAQPVIHWASVFLCFHFTCATFMVLNNSAEEITNALATFLFQAPAF